MHKQFSVAQRIFIEHIAFFIRTDMDAGGKKFSFFDGAIGVLHIDRTGTNAFNLSSGKRDPGFVGIFDKIVVIGFFVERQF